MKPRDLLRSHLDLLEVFCKVPPGTRLTTPQILALGGYLPDERLYVISLLTQLMYHEYILVEGSSWNANEVEWFLGPLSDQVKEEGLIPE